MMIVHPYVTHHHHLDCCRQLAATLQTAICICRWRKHISLIKSNLGANALPLNSIVSVVSQFKYAVEGAAASSQRAREPTDKARTGYCGAYIYGYYSKNARRIQNGNTYIHCQIAAS